MFTIAQTGAFACNLLLRSGPCSGIILAIRTGEEEAVLLKLSGHISNCLERAASAEKRAQQSNDSTTRSDHEFLAQSWRHLALSYQFVESLERFLSDADGNKKSVLPPEMPIAGEPATPEVKRIIRRPRVKHEASFQDRLLKSAQGRTRAGQAVFRDRARAPAAEGQA